MISFLASGGIMLPVLFNSTPMMTAVKITWAVFVFGCLLINLWTFREAMIDKRYVHRQTTNPANRIRAWQSVRDEFVTLMFQFFLFGIRFWAIFWPSPDNLQFRQNWAIDGTVITILQVFLAYNCILDLRDRRRTVSEDRVHHPSIGA